MKRRYVKPTLCVEHYALTQSIASCSGIKIGDKPNKSSDQDVLADPDATNAMKSWAQIGGFLSSGGCTIPMEGVILNDGVCVHTNINAAFNS